MPPHTIRLAAENLYPPRLVRVMPCGSSKVPLALCVTPLEPIELKHVRCDSNNCTDLSWGAQTNQPACTYMHKHTHTHTNVTYKYTRPPPTHITQKVLSLKDGEWQSQT